MRTKFIFWVGAVTGLLFPLNALAIERVMTSTTTLQSLVGEVVGEKVSVQSIAKGPQDPHYVEAKPSYMVKANRADLFVAVGLDLEIGWIRNVLRGSRNPTIQEGRDGFLEVGSFIDPIEVPKGVVNRALGDIHASGNPHFYLDPLRTVQAVDGLAEKLAKLNPKERERYKKNAKQFTERIHREMESWLKRIKQSGVEGAVTYHRTLNYFLDRFGIQFVDSIESKPGIPPSARHILKVMKRIEAGGVLCLLNESFFELKSAKRIGEKTGIFVKEVATEVGAMEGVNDYFALIEHLVSSVEACGSAKRAEGKGKE